MSGPGDVNHDGFADVIIGSRAASPNGPSSGASYVFFGHGGAFAADFALSSLNGANGFRLRGAAAQDFAGYAVGSAGDVNGDHIDDLLIGSMGADANGVDSGAAYVVFGSAGGFTPDFDISAVNGSNGFRITGANIGDRSGYSVSAAGDVNGDTIGDLVLGARGSGPGGAAGGAAFVIFGHAGAFSADFALSSLNRTNGFKVTGIAGEDFAGISASGARDVDHDGFADVILGAYAVAHHGVDSGAAYVLYGKASGFAASFPLSTITGANGFAIEGVSAGDLSGFSVSAAGDVNDDGFADMIVGAHRADPHGDDSGASYLFFGFAKGTPLPSVSIGNASLGEGDSGAATLTFTVRLSAASNEIVTVQYATADGTAFAGEDYQALPLTTLMFLPGEVMKQFDVTINGDTKVETVESFRVLLSGAHNALISAGTGTGTIRNDDFIRSGPTVSFPEPDGDMVSVRATGPGLGAVDVTLADDGSIASIDLSGQSAARAGTAKLHGAKGASHAAALKPVNLMVSVTPNASGQSDGLTSVGLLDATGLSIGTVKIAGHLGHFLAGGKTGGKSVIKNLTVDGNLGGSAGGAPMISHAFGSVGKLAVKGNVQGGAVLIDGRVTTLSVNGDLLAGTVLQAGSAHSINISGSVRGATNLGGSINSLLIGGSVQDARILAGYGQDGKPSNPDARIGRVVVNGDWSASSLVAGIDDATGDGFGRNDAVISGRATPSILSQIASVIIRGTASGTETAGDFFGITAQRLGAAIISGHKLKLKNRAPDNLPLEKAHSDFRLVEVR